MREMQVDKTALEPETSVNWPTVGFVVLFHVASVVALWFWSWPAIITAAVLYWVGGSLGIGMGYHRLLSHRGYKVPKVVEYSLIFCGALALEGGPIQWATTHRIHHAHTDREGDPHTPRDGRWWSHIGWILAPPPQVLDQAQLQRYAPDLINQRFYRWLNRFYYVPLIMLAIGLLAFVAGESCYGASSCGLLWAFILPGWLTRRPTCGADAGSPRVMIRLTTGGSRC